jgi:hypothetical protein
MPSTINKTSPQAFRLDRARSVFEHHGRHDDLVQESVPPGRFAGPDELAELLADLRASADHLGLDFYKALNDSYQLYMITKTFHEDLLKGLNLPSTASA